MSPQPREWLHDIEHEYAALSLLAEKHGHSAAGLEAKRRLAELREMVRRGKDDCR